MHINIKAHILTCIMIFLTQIYMIKPYNAARKTYFWYKKVAIHLIQVALLNSFILSKKANPEERIDFLKFQNSVGVFLYFEYV